MGKNLINGSIRKQGFIVFYDNIKRWQLQNQTPQHRRHTNNCSYQCFFPIDNLLRSKSQDLSIGGHQKASCPPFWYATRKAKSLIFDFDWNCFYYFFHSSCLNMMYLLNLSLKRTYIPRYCVFSTLVSFGSPIRKQFEVAFFLLSSSI